MFIQKRAVRSAYYIFIIGAQALRRLDEHVTLDKSLTIFFSNRKV